MVTILAAQSRPPHALDGGYRQNRPSVQLHFGSLVGDCRRVTKRHAALSSEVLSGREHPFRNRRLGRPGETKRQAPTAADTTKSKSPAFQPWRSTNHPTPA